MTRKEYVVDKKYTFEEYYTHVAKLAGGFRFSSGFIQKVKAALAAGDEHLNTIPLSEWDAMAAPRRIDIHRALLQCDDYWGLAGGACVMKQAAKNQAKDL